MNNVYKKEEKRIEPMVVARVARWHFFKLKTWVNFGGSYIQCKMLVYFMTIWSILLTGIFCGFYRRLVYFSRFGMLYQVKSGNPGGGWARRWRCKLKAEAQKKR
jgi:hypothetical protein